MVSADSCNEVTDGSDIAELSLTDAGSVFRGATGCVTQFGELVEFFLGHGRRTCVAA